MAFRIRGLAPEPFMHLYGLADQELAAHGARRVVADACPGYPDRIELRDAEPGESLLLLNYEHQPAATPYRSRHAIFVLEGARRAHEFVDEIPPVIRRRPISLRAFSAGGEMLDAELCDGTALESAIARLFALPDAACLHAHYAARGCYAACIERA